MVEKLAERKNKDTCHCSLFSHAALNVQSYHLDKASASWKKNNFPEENNNVCILYVCTADCNRLLI